MKFKFKLEGLLRHRKNLEQEALREMIGAQNDLENAQRQLNDLYEQIELARKNRFDSEIGGIESPTGEGEQLSYVELFIDGQKHRIEAQKFVIREKQVVFERTQDLYRKAAIELKVIEKLKERRREEHRKAANKLEQKKIDEMVSLRFGRKESGL